MAELSTTLAGEPVGLLPEGALWWPAQRLLMVADAHIGKAVSFRRLGVPVPQGTTTETLDALSQAVARTGAQRIVFLGDLLHSARSHAPDTLAAMAAWRAAHATLELTLVRGNHDDRAGDPPPGWAMDVVDEPWCRGGLALCHHPQAVPDHDAVGGHLHPGVVLAHAFERLRLPCFHLREGVLVLPAFGSFTGLHLVAPSPTDRVFAIVGDELRELPSG